MKITVDTNVLVLAVLGDDIAQAKAAKRILETATLIAVPLPCLCEFVWILSRSAGLAKADIIRAIEALANARNVVMNRPAVEAGLALFAAGGDFADGVIAHEGQWLGGETFVSFDKAAVKLLLDRGQAARLLV